jgi:hypothetical protein
LLVGKVRVSIIFQHFKALVLTVRNKGFLTIPGMSYSAPNRYVNPIRARIVRYCDLGVHSVWHIHRRLVDDTGVEEWADLYDPDEFYTRSANTEEEIIEDVLRSADRWGSMFHSGDQEDFIVNCWNHGERDLARITEQTVEFQRTRGSCVQGIDIIMVMNVLTEMGFIV